LVVGSDVFVAFSPERIDPGNERYGVRNTPKVVGGLTEECTRRAAAFYGQFVDTVVQAKGAREAEMSKLIENTFRHVNIALVNEMLRFSHELDIDLWNAIDCAETKPFGYMAFRPGPGVGGHCIPVDPSYLSHRVKAQLGYSFRMVELAEEINTAAPLYVANRLRDLLNDRGRAVKGSRVLLLGVTYKANISDCRESPADPLAKQLLAWGADLVHHDPYVPVWNPHGVDATLDVVTDLDWAVRDADVVVLLQTHAEYDLQSLADASAVLLDTRGAVGLHPHVEVL
jgi:nucleotide sugar dehydrogenase